MTKSEWQTRKQRIDTRLRSVNPAWQIMRYREGLDLPAPPTRLGKPNPIRADMIWIVPSNKDTATDKLGRRLWEAADKFRPLKRGVRRPRCEVESVRHAAFVIPPAAGFNFSIPCSTPRAAPDS